MSTHLTLGLVVQAILASVVLSLPYLAVGVHKATVLRRESGRPSRISPVLTRMRAAWRSGTAGAGSPGPLPAPAPGPDGRGAQMPPTAAPAGLHRGQP